MTPTDDDDDDDQADRPANGGGVGAAGVVAAAAVNRADPTARTRTTMTRRRRAPKLQRTPTNSDGPDAHDSDDSDDSVDGDDGSGDGGNRRRRRRRRRKSGSGDDKTRAPLPTIRRTPWCTSGRHALANAAPQTARRLEHAEIKGIDGSTRLEAKRQRRRDGRDAGRRRPPVLTEAEFLARREAVERIMVVRDRVRTEPPHRVRATPRSRCSKTASSSSISSRRRRLLPGGQHLSRHRAERAALDGGGLRRHRSGRNGVLYAGEVNWEAAGLGGADRKIEQALKPGDYVVVQVSKDPVGHKGARLTTQVSLAGRYLVMCRVRRRPGSAASCPTPNASGSRRFCARWCRPTPG